MPVTRADIYGAAFWLGLLISQTISFYETPPAAWAFRGIHLLLAVAAMVFLAEPIDGPTQRWFRKNLSRKEKDRDPS